MGLKEYLQDELGLKDKDLVSMGMNVIMRFSLEVPGLYGEVEFSRVDPTLTPRVSGPFCTWHDRKPTPRRFNEEGKTLGWMHISMRDGRRVEELCPLATQLSERELEVHLHNAAEKVMARERPQDLKATSS
jgi:hypothetical protein